MSSLPPPDAASEKPCRDPFTAQLLDLIADQPGLSTAELGARLNQSRGRIGKRLARLRQAGVLTAVMPRFSNQPYGWTLAGPSAISVKPEPVITPEPEPEPEPEPKPVADDNGGDEEAGFSIVLLHSAPLPKGLTQEDLEWHRYWHSRAMQRAGHWAPMEKV